jgi:2-iminobutanoate/2-iminopropanoate deaminase
MKYLLTLLVLSLFGCQTDQMTAEEPVMESPLVEYLMTPSANSEGPFSSGVRVGNMLFLSGKIGTVPETGQLIEGGILPESRQVMDNIKATLEELGSSLENVVKCTVMIDDIAQWGAFNEIYVEYFPGPKPARSAFGADGLALGAAIEVECWAAMP